MGSRRRRRRRRRDDSLTRPPPSSSSNASRPPPGAETPSRNASRSKSRRRDANARRISPRRPVANPTRRLAVLASRFDARAWSSRICVARISRRSSARWRRRARRRRANSPRKSRRGISSRRSSATNREGRRADPPRTGTVDAQRRARGYATRRVASASRRRRFGALARRRRSPPRGPR